MAFPASPLNGATTTVNGINYTYSSANNAWTRTAYTNVSASSLTATGQVSAATLVTSSDAVVGGIIKSTGNIVAAATTASTSATTGALVVGGGAGIAGNLNVTGNVGLALTSTFAPNAAVTIRGYTDNSGTQSFIKNWPKTLFLGGDFNQAYNSGNAAILAIADYSNDVGDIVYPIYAEDENGFVDFFLFSGNNGSGTDKIAYFGGNVNAKGNLNIAATTTSTSATTGALVVAGGVGIGGNVVQSGWHLPSANLTYNLGSTTAWWNIVYGKSVQAQYADLAENYTADAVYDPGTVVVFGGTAEVTTTTITHDTRVAGVVSTDPAYLMNAAAGGTSVAMTGRVPCLVRGPVFKGTVLVTSDTPGVAEAIDYAKYKPGAVLGKSLGEILDDSIQTIEVVVGRF